MTRRAEPPSGGRQRPSIYDVARRAEVSHMTVSRVLNDHPNLREATRARVLRAIEELNFVPSSIARSLATRSARRIGVLIDAPAQSGPTSTLHALEKAARQVGYAVTALSIGDDQALQVGAGADELVALRVEALCVIAPRESSLDLLRRHRIGVPVVVVAPAPDSFWRTVCVDQRAGARLAVRHLVELGHRRIAHLAGPSDWFDARERAEGWRECLAEAGLGEGPLVVGDWTSDFGFASAQDLDPAQDTAVFAANDQIALGLVNGLHRRGIRVPEDVSVVGFDDLADSRHFLPPLTTVRQDFAALGESALRHVMAVVQGDEAEPAHDTIQPELIVRGSTRARHGG